MLASKVWKKSYPNFFIHCIKVQESWRHNFPIHSRSHFLSNAMNFFIHFLNRSFFKIKCLHVASFLQVAALHANIRHDPRSEYNQQESEHSECQRGWVVWECTETATGYLRDRAA